ncbi:MAG: hypothetical protein IH944_07535 [Armatimonadetes bacterium]|nr:hypothetical protein [Armatimonadota bacterium]
MKDPYKPGGGQSKFIRNTGTNPVKGKPVKNKNVRVDKAKKVRKKI